MTIRKALRVALVVPMIAACAPVTDRQDRERYLYYLHGKIVEDLGPRGISPRFGQYDYAGIIAAFRRTGLTIESEVRPKGTDPDAYAATVAADIRAKLAAGVSPSRITVAGASKGAVIATLVSTRLQQPGIRYVLIAACSEWLLREMRPRLSGEILSIYESSDDLAKSCVPAVRASPAVTRFSEIQLDTGLGHGIVYRPLPGWLNPAVAWAKR